MVKRYLVTSIPDFILCVLIAVCLVTTVVSGFYIPDYLTQNVALPILIAVFVSALLFFVAYSRRTIVIGGPCFLVVAVVLLLVARSVFGGNIFRDAEDNPCLYFILAVMGTVLVFLLSRTRSLSILLFVGGAILLSAIRFLYEDDHLITFLLFLPAAGAMYIFRYYRGNVLRAETKKVALGMGVVAAAFICALTLLLGAGLFYGIVAPAHPPARELKLITHEMALRTLDRIGVADSSITEDPDMDSDQTEQEPEGDQEQDSPDGVNQNGDADDDELDVTLLDDISYAFFSVLDYLTEYNRWVWVILALVLAMVAAVLYKCYRRRRWYRGILAQPGEEQVRRLYLFWMDRLHRLKIRKRPDDTLYQFTERAASSLTHFRGDVDFSALTKTYVKVHYGGESVTEEELAGFRTFHARFYHNTRTYLGIFRYAIRFFAL